MSGVTERYLDYRLKLVVGFTFLVVSACFLLETLYSEYARSLVSLFFVDEYSYLLIAVLTVAFTLYLTIKHVGLAYSITPSKVIISAMLASFAILFYFSSYANRDYMVQFQGFSFALVLLGMIILVYNPTMKRDLVPLLSILLLVPLPSSVIDYLTPILSRILGRVAAYITGAEFIARPGFPVIKVQTPSGPQVLEVETACTGIVTLSGVLAITPVILYLLAYSPRSSLRKALALVTSTVAALAVGLLGNLVRIILVIYGSQAYGVETGLKLFHYSPSAIYASIAVLTAFYISDKVGGIRHVAQQPMKIERGLEWRYVAGVVLILLVFTSLFYATATLISSMASPGGRGVVEVRVDDVKSFLDNPSMYLLSSTGVAILSQSYDSFLTRVLGALRVYSISLVINGVHYYGYVEVVDTPAKLHTWQLCLTLQGYKVLKSWTQLVNNTFIAFILAEKEHVKELLAYALYPLEVTTPSSTLRLYARISLLKYDSDLSSTSVDEIARALSALSAGTASTALGAIINTSVLISYGLLITFILYTAVTAISSEVIYMFRKILKRRRG